mmetsp:Transcript_28258/g.46367  ORF Transcript_28258/g.46367 Transcript_28258/m.46367 type:complete len:127 (-) Transcript_28258:299-679(-)
MSTTGTTAQSQLNHSNVITTSQRRNIRIEEYTMTNKSVFAATAAAFALASAATFAAEAPAGSSGQAVNATDTVHCYGLHDCKGNADCATTENACKGLNACKGHGFKAVEAGACLSKGGTIGDLGGK